MKHRSKTRIFKLLARLPNQMGYTIYHFLQKIGSKETLQSKIHATANTYQEVVAILKKNNLNLANLTIAEIGSGWLPIFPYQLMTLGKVKSVVTYDINEHYDRKELDKLNSIYGNPVRTAKKDKKYNLLKGVSYFPKTNISDTQIRDVDLVVSRFVLEHVSPHEIRQMHDFMYQNLKPNSYVLHLISPSDHRAYSDTSLSLQDFLKYSQQEWNTIQTKFDYHNRLRLPHYLTLLSEHFEMLYFEHDTVDIESRAYKKFKQLSIHPDYASFTEKELMAGSINILLKKGSK